MNLLFIKSPEEGLFFFFFQIVKAIISMDQDHQLHYTDEIPMQDSHMLH